MWGRPRLERICNLRGFSFSLLFLAICQESSQVFSLTTCLHSRWRGKTQTAISSVSKDICSYAIYSLGEKKTDGVWFLCQVSTGHFLRSKKYNLHSLVASMVKNLPAMQEIGVWSLGWEDPLETGMATHSSILDWRIPQTEKPGGSPRVRHDWLTNAFTTFMIQKNTSTVD